jgi:hypothetical protein
MTALEFNTQFFSYMAEISADEALSAKLIKYMKKLVAKKKDPTEMTHEEFLQRVEEAAKGETMSFDSVDDLDKYIRSL